MDLTPKGYRELSRTWLFQARESWTLPVLSRGLLYVVQNTREIGRETDRGCSATTCARKPRAGGECGPAIADLLLSLRCPEGGHTNGETVAGVVHGGLRLGLVVPGGADLDKVPIGSEVQLTRQDGGVVEGKLTARDEETVTVDAGRVTRSVPRGDIAHIGVADASGKAPELPAIARFREYRVPSGTAVGAAGRRRGLRDQRLASGECHTGRGGEDRRRRRAAGGQPRPREK